MGNSKTEALLREAHALRETAQAMQDQMMQFAREMGQAIDILDKATRDLNARIAATTGDTVPAPAPAFDESVHNGHGEGEACNEGCLETRRARMAASLDFAPLDWGVNRGDG